MPTGAGISAESGLGIRTCERNLGPSDDARRFDAARYGPPSLVVPDFAAPL